MPRWNDPSKKCSKCEKFKPRGEFGASTRSRDGVASYCKMCSSERQRYYRKLSADKNKPAVSEKRCSYCREVKPAIHFGPRLATPDGLSYLCTPCKNAGGQRRWAGTPISMRRDVTRLKYLAARYGITPDEYEVMLRSQNSKCAICGDEGAPYAGKGAPLYVDHNHTNGKIRGLLCNKCNSLTGALEREGFLQRALAYLEKYGDSPLRAA